MPEIFDNELNDLYEDKEFECDMCGKLTESEGYCSLSCAMADER